MLMCRQYTPIVTGQRASIPAWMVKPATTISTCVRETPSVPQIAEMTWDVS